MRPALRRSYSDKQFVVTVVKGEDMMSAGETGTEQGAVGVYPDGGRSIWLLGMLATFKAVSEETGGEYSLYELTVPPQLGALPHIHHRETEAYYVLDGEVEFLKGERTVRAGVGEFVFVPGAWCTASRVWGRGPPGSWGSLPRAGYTRSSLRA
jgi:mannose-6-phosphate isomerase-like protein (cupin superfamily)